MFNQKFLDHFHKHSVFRSLDSEIFPRATHFQDKHTELSWEVIWEWVEKLSWEESTIALKSGFKIAISNNKIYLIFLRYMYHSLSFLYYKHLNFISHRTDKLKREKTSPETDRVAIVLGNKRVFKMFSSNLLVAVYIILIWASSSKTTTCKKKILCTHNALSVCLNRELIAFTLLFWVCLSDLKGLTCPNAPHSSASNNHLHFSFLFLHIWLCSLHFGGDSVPHPKSMFSLKLVPEPLFSVVSLLKSVIWPHSSFLMWTLCHQTH